MTIGMHLARIDWPAGLAKPCSPNSYERQFGTPIKGHAG